MYFPLCVGVLRLSLFRYALLCVHFSFAIILKRKRKMVASLLLSYRCIFTVVLPRGAMDWSAVWYFLIILTYFIKLPIHLL